MRAAGSHYRTATVRERLHWTISQHCSAEQTLTANRDVTFTHFDRILRCAARPSVLPPRARKRPGLALTAIISLTLGIGATTAVFSVIYGLLVNPYLYQGADRMIHLNVLNERGERRWVGITGPQLRLLRQVNCNDTT